jgi:hypothetical protein
MNEESPIFDNWNEVEVLLEEEYEFTSLDIKEYEVAVKEEKRRSSVLARKIRFLKEEGKLCPYAIVVV